LRLELLESGQLLPLLHLLLLLALGLQAGLDLHGQFLAIFNLLAVPLKELLLVQLQVLHALLVHHPLTPIVVRLHMA
jgi:hypothetical protein